MLTSSIKKAEILASSFGDLCIILTWKKAGSSGKAQQELTAPWQETDNLCAFSQNEKLVTSYYSQANPKT